MSSDSKTYFNADMMKFKPTVKNFFHKDTSTNCFVVSDPATKDAVIIDSVTDLDATNWQVSNKFNEQVVDFVKSEGLKVHWSMDTHVHADHLTGLTYIKSKLGVPCCIGEKITQVQKTFSGIFNKPEFQCDGSQFDRLLADGDVVEAGSLKFTCWHTPGHTPACMTYLIGDAAFTGDLMFMEDVGCGRCDFPGGSAADMYDSVMRLYNNLHPDTRVFVCHDYQPNGRELRYCSTIGLEREKQEDLPASGEKEEFIKGKTEFDKTLDLPRLVFPSLLVNMAAGVLPDHERGSEHRYLKIPLNTRQPTDDLGAPLTKQKASESKTG